MVTYYNGLFGLVIFNSFSFTSSMKHIVVEGGLRIDRYCSRYISELTSLKRAKKWVKQGNILLEGTQVETSRFVRKGDCLTIILN